MNGVQEDVAWIKIGHAWSSMRYYTEALTAYEQAISLQARNIDAWESKIRTLSRLHRYRQAWAAFRHTLKFIVVPDRGYRD